MKITFQYLVRGGIVLHQLLFENLTPKSVPLGELILNHEPYIRDLNYLDLTPDKHTRYESIVKGFGRCTVRPIPEGQVAAVIDLFIDGERFGIHHNGTMPVESEMDRLTLKGLLPRTENGKGHIREIVVAYKLEFYPKGSID